MPSRDFPVRPNLDQLRIQAKELLRGIRRGDPAALAEFSEHRGRPIEPSDAKLADAQHALARSYGIESWPRIVLACRVTGAILRDDAEELRELILKRPALLHEMARGVKRSTWGPPMSYAANLGRMKIVAMLRELGAKDLQFAFNRAVLQGQLETARQLYAMGARPEPGCLMGPAETLRPEGIAFLLELGATIGDAKGDPWAPVETILQGYARNPAGKHQCLELLAAHGRELPDTPPMAVHLGRIELLEKHLQRDPGLLSRTFAHREIYPLEAGCSVDESYALHATPLQGGTLLHLCVDYDEVEIARWLIERGMAADARAAIDEQGFGGHTALFGTVVVQSGRARGGDEFARLLLDAGADPNARASLRKQLRFVGDDAMHEYRDVTPLAWGRDFHYRPFVSAAAMKLIAERGGHE